MGGFFSWWKGRNIILKIVLFIIPLTMALLWILGSFTKFDRLIMFMVGLLVGGLLINIFLGPQISSIIQWFKDVFSTMFSSGDEAAIFLTQIF